MADNLSQASFYSTQSRFQTPKKVMVDGELLDGEYFTKQVIFNSNIQIETPELIKNKVHGDKTILVRLLQINDQTIADNNKDKTIFQLIALNQRNNFNSEGRQTNIIGYGTYNVNIDRWQIDSQCYEQDSFYPIKLTLNINKRDGDGYVPYTLPQDNVSFVQYDIQTIYNFI